MKVIHLFVIFHIIIVIIKSVSYQNIPFMMNPPSNVLQKVEFNCEILYYIVVYE